MVLLFWYIFLYTLLQNKAWYGIYVKFSFFYPAILHLFKCSNRHLKLLLVQNARNYTTPKQKNGLTVIIWVLLPYEFTLLQNLLYSKKPITLVLLPYEFTLLQNLKRGYLKLLPVHVSQGFSITFYHIANLLLKTYWLPYLWKFVQLPCNFAPLQMLK